MTDKFDENSAIGKEGFQNTLGTTRVTLTIRLELLLFSRVHLLEGTVIIPGPLERRCCNPGDTGRRVSHMKERFSMVGGISNTTNEQHKCNISSIYPSSVLGRLRRHSIQ